MVYNSDEAAANCRKNDNQTADRPSFSCCGRFEIEPLRETFREAARDAARDASPSTRFRTRSASKASASSRRAEATFDLARRRLP